MWFCSAHPLPEVLRRREQPPGHGHWSLGTEAAPKLSFHHSCLVLAVAMAPVHQPEGTGEHLVQLTHPCAWFQLWLSQAGSHHAVPLCSQEGMELSDWRQKCGYLGRLIRAEGNRGSSLSAWGQLVTTAQTLLQWDTGQTPSVSWTSTEYSWEKAGKALGKLSVLLQTLTPLKGLRAIPKKHSPTICISLQWKSSWLLSFSLTPLSIQSD